MARKVNLMRYLPEFIGEYHQIKAIMETEKPEFDFGFVSIEQVFHNQFVMDCNVDGIRRWEQLLNLKPNATDTLEIRKFRVIAKLSNSELPYTYRKLVQRLTELVGANNFTINLQANDYSIDIRVLLESAEKFSIVDDVVREMIPANLVLDFARLEEISTTLFIGCAIANERVKEKLLGLNNFPNELSTRLYIGNAIVREKIKEKLT